MSVTLYADKGTSVVLAVEIAFGYTQGTDPAGWVWADITADVMVADQISIVRGRPDAASQVAPMDLSLALKNSDGKYTPGNPLSAYFPNVRLRTPIRVRMNSTVRFGGFVDSWPMAWPGGVETFSTVRLRASGRWMALSQEPAIIDMLISYIQYLGPVAYYPMIEPVNAPGPSDYSAFNNQTLRTGDWVFGSYEKLSTSRENKQAVVRYTLPRPGATPLTIHIPGYTPAGGTAFIMQAEHGVPAYDFEVAQVALSDSSILLIQKIVSLPGYRIVRKLNGVDTTIVSSGLSRLRFSLTQSGGNVVLTQQTNAGSTAVTGSWAGTLPSIRWVAVTIPPGVVYDEALFFDGGVGHVAVLPRALTTDESDVLEQAFENGNPVNWYYVSGNPSNAQLAHLRIRRVALTAGYRDDELALEAGTTQLTARFVGNGMTKLAWMQLMAASDPGLLYETLSGGLGFHNRDHRVNAPVWLQLDAAAGELAPGLEPTFDDQDVINDYTVDRYWDSGRYVDQDSVNRYGLKAATLTTVGGSNLYGTYLVPGYGAEQIASWLVNASSEPRVRIKRIRFYLQGRAAVLAQWLTGEPIGSRMLVVNGPNPLQDSDLDFFIEGYTEVIDFATWTVEANCSPADPLTRVFTIDDTKLGRLQLEGQTLATGRDTVQTSWSIATATGKALLTTAGFPFDVECEGEQMTVTGITGASSPQTATVVRSVNGVVRSHTAGAVLKLWRPGVLKL